VGSASALAKKGAVFQFNTINPLNPQWDSAAAGNAALADVASGGYAISWTYNYYISVDPQSLGYSLPNGLHFVPMIYGDTGATYGTPYSSANVTAAGAMAQSAQGDGTVMSFNEPNQVNQANMTAARAAQIWPAFSALRGQGIRVGAPAMGWRINNAMPTWLAVFVTAVGSADFDFIPIDLYADNFNDPTGEAAKVVAFATTLQSTYNKPVWLKEFAVISYGSLPSQPNHIQAEAFMDQMFSRMRTSSIFERHSWYRVGPGRDATDSGYYMIGLYNTNGTRSQIGEHFHTLWHKAANDNHTEWTPSYALAVSRERRRRRGGRMRRAA
jgi:hypothetical protein